MRGPLELRLWSRVEKGEGCWLWTGTVDGHGYGVLGRGGRGEGNVLAHRAAWELTHGPIDEARPHLDHLCRVRLCVNPEHLEPVTQAENNRRAWAVNRASHCPQGHEFTPENTYPAGRNPQRGRSCRECHRIRSAAAYQRRRSA